mgnify:CR=1 FL=1
MAAQRRIIRPMTAHPDAKIFLVDDDAGVRDALAWLLRTRRLLSEGYDSAEAFEAEAVVWAEAPQAPCCVLLDVRMPGMGGLNVQEEMRARGIDLPVIFVSGHADVPIVVRAFKAGAVDFIEKPYNEQLLLDSVQQALERRAPPVRQDPRLADVQARLDQLTPRERDVLLPLVRGYTNREVAEQLDISVKTVDLYRSRVMKRMQAESLPELVGMAIAAGLVDSLALREPARA